MKELKIEAKLENLDPLLEFVNTELEEIHCPKKTQNQISIAVEEIFVNIVHYAYQPVTGFALVRAGAGNSEIRIEFEDTGKPYNPLDKANPDITSDVEDRIVGGLGVFLVKKIMDKVEYRFEGNRNLLSIVKTIPNLDD
ncbi:MAG: ATP-binding protein [Treponema sp.]|jgi:anti-sigma regulatory factor (Ser/Thr protein kinase)|nr:ATP-binding protein [Treponema sp.]